MNEVVRTFDNPLFRYGSFARLRAPGVWVILAIVGVLSLFFLGIPFAAAVASHGDFRQVSESITGVLWAFYVLQWIRLRYGRAWIGALAAWLFLFWGGPILLAAFAEAPSHLAHLLGGLFPGIGVLMSYQEKHFGSSAILGLLNLFGSLFFTLKAVGVARGLAGVGALLPDATAPRRRDLYSARSGRQEGSKSTSSVI